MTTKKPGVGVGVFVVKDGKVLLGKRLGSHGKGKWCPPGGHLEFGEDVEECMRREALEEVGVKIKNVKMGPWVNNFYPDEDNHYVALIAVSDYESGEVRVLEPDKFETWDWFDWDDLPSPLFDPIQSLKDEGFNPNFF